MEYAITILFLPTSLQCTDWFQIAFLFPTELFNSLSARMSFEIAYKEDPAGAKKERKKEKE